MASRRLNSPTGTTRMPLGTTAGSREVTSTRPAGPAGHRPSRFAVPVTSSSTTSQERLVSPSQLRNWAATDSLLLAWSRPVAAAVAAAYPDSTDSRLVASIQTMRSTPRDCHRDSAKAAASWVLPDDLCQCRASRAATGPGDAVRSDPRAGTSATAAPAGSAAARLGAVSGLVLKSSASAGTVPDRIGQEGRPGTVRAASAGVIGLLVAALLTAALATGRRARAAWLPARCPPADPAAAALTARRSRRAGDWPG